ncbi:hypothetical protein GGQ88_000238 [Novosphingobium hassiacum]|uniref:Uncharacterized protein n=1 Tax=Novosphingobium hassiacum TaxID=173676 RepID=A0A7W5ZS40_9SPHN|nr:hypothetical protein [Novosphingobium hassiacum]MBB3858998.1 hypothetical protein [Novosphingobium hassiacum]
MILIRTAEALARALDSPLDAVAKRRLRFHAERLAEYDDFAFEELAVFAVVQPGDALADIEVALGMQVLVERDFAMIPEIVERHWCWAEAIFILSDDGFGLVLLVPLCQDTDSALLTAIQSHIGESQNSSVT